MKPSARHLSVLLLCCIFLAGVPLASAQDDSTACVTFWRGEPGVVGSWFDWDLWSAGVPTARTYAYISNGGIAAIGDPATDARPAVAAGLHLGGYRSGTVEQKGGRLEVGGTTWLGLLHWGMPVPEGYPGPGRVQPGRYALLDGTFSSGNVYIGSGLPYWSADAVYPPRGSVFRQIGGHSEIADVLRVGFSPYPVITRDPVTGEVDAAASMGSIDADYLYRPGALYDLAGGSLFARRAYVGYGGKGLIRQGDGEARFGALFVGGGHSWSYPLPMDGRPTVDSLAAHPWYFDGGTYALSGGVLGAETIHVGQRGRGTFTQSGGTAKVARTLQVGGNWWWYPALRELDPITNSDVNAEMSSAMVPEYYLPADGTYNLTDGELMTANTEIGIGGRGRFVQSGGAHTVEGTLRIGGTPYWPILDPVRPVPRIDADASLQPDGFMPPWPYPGPASGSYHLSDGTLTAGRMVLGAGFRAWPMGWTDPETPRSADRWAPIPWRPANFTQTGGSVNVEAGIRILGGRYHLADGYMTASRLHLADGNAYGASTFIQTGGSARIAGELLLGPEMTICGGDAAMGGETSGAGDSSLARYYGPLNVRIEAGRLGAGAIRLTGRRPATLTQTGGSVLAARGVRIVGDNAAVHLRGGTMETSVMQVGQLVNKTPYVTPGNRLTVGAKAVLSVTDRLVFGLDGKYGAEDGVEIRMSGASLDNYSTSSLALSGLGSTQMTFFGSEDEEDWATFEVAGRDLGFTRQGFWNNFVLDSLVLGLDADNVGRLRLVDEVVNQPMSPGDEALYVRRLVINPGSRLDLNGLNIYYLSLSLGDDADILNGELAAADAVRNWAVPGDANMDGKVDLEDFVILKRNFGRRAGVHWGHGDFAGNGVVDLNDFVVLKNNFGIAAVPEPATLSVLLLAAPLLIRRRK